MSEKNGTIPRKDFLSRRDFLKVTASLALPLALPPLESPPSTSPEMIETENATFYPFFESHKKHPNLQKEIDLLPKMPAIHFYEIVTETSAMSFQSESPSTLLDSKIFGRTGEPYGSLIEKPTQDFFAANNINVAFEGTHLPSKYFKSERFKDLEVTAVVGVDVAALWTDITKAMRLRGEEFNKNDLLLNIAALLSTAWVGRSSIITFLSSKLDEMPQTSDLQQIRTSLRNIDNLIGNRRPGDMVVFFRNIIMARKLQTLAKFAPANSQLNLGKPAISFLIGMAHTGIKDLLNLGESATLAGLEIYPADVLRDVVNSNGGIDAFCSTVVIPTWENIVAKREIKRIALDQELKDYLETRIGK